jgi:hypothetical protein
MRHTKVYGGGDNKLSRYCRLHASAGAGEPAILLLFDSDAAQGARQLNEFQLAAGQSVVGCDTSNATVVLSGLPSIDRGPTSLTFTAVNDRLDEGGSPEAALEWMAALEAAGCSAAGSGGSGGGAAGALQPRASSNAAGAGGRKRQQSEKFVGQVYGCDDLGSSPSSAASTPQQSSSMQGTPASSDRRMNRQVSDLSYFQQGGFKQSSAASVLERTPSSLDAAIGGGESDSGPDEVSGSSSEEEGGSTPPRAKQATPQATPPHHGHNSASGGGAAGAAPPSRMPVQEPATLVETWYYHDGSAQHGPVTAAYMEKSFAEGRFDPSACLVWRPGQAE